jgi:hypothetical protein
MILGRRLDGRRRGQIGLCSVCWLRQLWGGVVREHVEVPTLLRVSDPGRQVPSVDPGPETKPTDVELRILIDQKITIRVLVLATSRSRRQHLVFRRRSERSQGNVPAMAPGIQVLWHSVESFWYSGGTLSCTEIGTAIFLSKTTWWRVRKI